MHRLIEELYFGNINPCERNFLRNKDYKKALGIFSSSEKKLTELLDGKEKSIFLDLLNAQSELDGITSVEHFIHGFRMGAQFAIEVLYNNDGYLVDSD